MRDSSVIRVVQAVLTGSNLSFFASSIAHRCSLIAQINSFDMRVFPT